MGLFCIEGASFLLKMVPWKYRTMPLIVPLVSGIARSPEIFLLPFCFLLGN
jgi:hypothetical protein